MSEDFNSGIGALPFPKREYEAIISTKRERSSAASKLKSAPHSIKARFFNCVSTLPAFDRSPGNGKRFGDHCPGERTRHVDSRHVAKLPHFETLDATAVVRFARGVHHRRNWQLCPCSFGPGGPPDFNSSSRKRAAWLLDPEVVID